VISKNNLQLCLKAVRNSIIADNRFDVITNEPNIYLGDYENRASRSVQIRGNIFFKQDLKEAVEVNQDSMENILVRDNILGSNYPH